MKYLFPYILVAVIACGGGSRPPSVDLPTDPAVTLDRFMAAVREDNLELMGQLWGSQRGPAAQYLDDGELSRRLTTMQVFLSHRAYRVVGPAVAARGDGFRQAFEVEITRANGCTDTFPVELVRTREQRWIVVDVHLEEVENPARPCTPPS